MFSLSEPTAWPRAGPGKQRTDLQPGPAGPSLLSGQPTIPRLPDTRLSEDLEENALALSGICEFHLTLGTFHAYPCMSHRASPLSPGTRSVYLITETRVDHEPVNHSGWFPSFPRTGSGHLGNSLAPRVPLPGAGTPNY